MWMSLLGTAAASVDRAVVRAAAWNTQRGTPRVAKLSHDERMAALAEITQAWGDPRFLDEPALLFPEPSVPHLACERVRHLSHGASVFDATWPSEHQTHVREIQERYSAHARNRSAHARLFLGATPRPAVIAIHGYMGGQYGFEERAFPVEWMMRRGFDVALFVLPFHSLRARTDQPGAPPFPGADPRFSIEGCRQAVHDLRGLMAFLRARGAPSVGVMGMSLGGYVASLLTTLEKELSFAVPIIPLASFGDFAREQGRFGKGANAVLQHRAFETAMRVVSPLARKPAIDKERILILAGEHDRVTPKTHAERLASHFGAKMVLFPGGHLLQFGRGDAFREVGRFWRGLGLTSAAPSSPQRA
jgi:pimeloyl-ACP methyl ester carboxylesterase